MPNETAASTSTSCSAWQQSTTTTTNSNNTSTDTPPDTALLPVNMIYLFYHCVLFSFYSRKIGPVLLKQLLNHR
jgi:hypothetical protein